MSVAKFHHFFDEPAGLNVDKKALKRYGDFVNHGIYDLPLRGEATAKGNRRDIISLQDQVF
jgi:hypothetical protein